MSQGEKTLAGLRVLVLEDELLVAMGLEDAPRSFGCVVVGPFATIAEADRAVTAGGFDVAVLDVNLRGELSFALAERLQAAGTPFVLCSGYAELAFIPNQFAAAPRLSKPYLDDALRAALERAAGA